MIVPLKIFSIANILNCLEVNSKSIHIRDSNLSYMCAIHEDVIRFHGQVFLIFIQCTENRSTRVILTVEHVTSRHQPVVLGSRCIIGAALGIVDVSTDGPQ